MKMKRKQGFTLVELMCVIVIIAILLSLAIPGLLRSKMTANESSAISSTRTISTAEAQFKQSLISDANSDGQGDYGTLDQLANPGMGSEPFIDEVLGSGFKEGYEFMIDVVPGSDVTPATYECWARPAVQDRTGVRKFYVDQTGVVRFSNDGSEPGPTSPPIG